MHSGSFPARRRRTSQSQPSPRPLLPANPHPTACSPATMATTATFPQTPTPPRPQRTQSGVGSLSSGPSISPRSRPSQAHASSSHSAASSSRINDRPLSMASFRSGLYDGEQDGQRRKRKPKPPQEVRALSSPSRPSSCPQHIQTHSSRAIQSLHSPRTDTRACFWLARGV